MLNNKTLLLWPTSFLFSSQLVRVRVIITRMTLSATQLFSSAPVSARAFVRRMPALRRRRNETMRPNLERATSGKQDNGGYKNLDLFPQFNSSLISVAQNERCFKRLQCETEMHYYIILVNLIECKESSIDTFATMEYIVSSKKFYQRFIAIECALQ